MSQSREEKRTDSPFDQSRLPHYQRPVDARANVVVEKPELDVSAWATSWRPGRDV